MNKSFVIAVLLFGISTSCVSQTVLITGANKGIGLALVKEYLDQDATV